MNTVLSPLAELSVNEAAAYMNIGLKATRQLMANGTVVSYHNTNGQLVTCPKECDSYLASLWDSRWREAHIHPKRRGVRAA